MLLLVEVCHSGNEALTATEISFIWKTIFTNRVFSCNLGMLCRIRNICSRTTRILLIQQINVHKLYRGCCFTCPIYVNKIKRLCCRIIYCRFFIFSLFYWINNKCIIWIICSSILSHFDAHEIRIFVITILIKFQWSLK